MERVLLLSVIFTLLPMAWCGFSQGEPCHSKNIALLNPTRPVWPRNHVHCADMRNMGNSSWFTYVNRLKNITTIYADSMLLKRLPIKAISSLPKLELLDVTNNSIRRVHPKTFARNLEFSTLLLTNNRVNLRNNKPFLYSKSLTTLYLTKNHIKSVPSIAFTELPSVMVLFLDSNDLTALKPKVFAPLRNLKMLHLGNNLLAVIPPRGSLPKSLVTYITKSNPRIDKQPIKRRRVPKKYLKNRKNGLK